MSLAPNLARALEEKGYVDATPVQEAVHGAGDGDLLVSSQTGSGKTLAFGLATAPLLSPSDTRPRILVVAPTRELAQQVARELTWLYRPIRVTTCVGGMDIRREQRALAHGAAVVVGTPGRLVDHIERRALDLSRVGAVVLDEADEMLDMGFREELEKILAAAPAERRTLLFSATIPKLIEALAKKYTKDAKRVAVGASSKQAHEDISFVGHLVAPREREHAVVNVLRAHDAPVALVFCATRDGVAHLHGALVERGFRAVALSGELSQAERNRALHEVREGRARVLVCTDVAARGLDLPAAALVIHADLPQNAEVLTHRSGRTGRAGKKGTAVILAPFAARRRAEVLLRSARAQGEWTPPPTPDDIRALDQARLVDAVGALVGDSDADDLAVAAALVERFGAERVASALVRRERATLPAAEDLPATFGQRSDHRDFEMRGPRERRDRAFERAAPRDRDDRDDRGDRGDRGDRDDGERPARKPRPHEREDRQEGAWFRVNVGRAANADPKWLVPMICRRGHINKRDIGRIEIKAKETRFEINPAKAAAFESKAAEPDAKDPKIRIERA